VPLNFRKAEIDDPWSALRSTLARNDIQMDVWIQDDLYQLAKFLGLLLES
jgi:hypothetical protein